MPAASTEEAPLQLTWDEVHSLAESNREVILADTWEGDCARDTEFVIPTEEGSWQLNRDDGHLSVEQVTVVPHNMQGQVRHVGLVHGKCSRDCLRAHADGALAAALPRTLKVAGLTWVLQAGTNYREPEYTSAAGWVSYGPWYDFPRRRGRWSRGNGYHEPKKTYRTYREAMHAQVRAERAEYEYESAHCATCGQRLRRRLRRRSPR